MKKTTFLLLSLALALPLFGRSAPRLSRLTKGSPESLMPLAVDPAVPARVLGQLRAQLAKTRATSGPRAQTIADAGSARAFFFPVAGSTAGGGGTLFFRSDVTLVNYRSTAQKVLAGFWPAGSTNTLTVANFKQITLNSNQFVTVQDFVATTMGTSGLGTLVFIPFDGTNIDPNGAIDGFSRIYTKQPGSNGTVSQPFEAVSTETGTLLLKGEGVALGLRQDANYRTNFGIANVDSAPHTVKVFFTGDNLSTTLTRTIPAYGMIFEAAPTGDYGALQIIFQIQDGDPTVTWTGFASSTDNITGDGWVSIASTDLTPAELDFIGY